MKRLLTSLALAAFVSPASACINESRLPTQEREFRSSYGKQSAPPRSPSVPMGSGWLLGSGAGLLIGAAAVAFIPRKK
jgi:hypothetical protein